MGPVTQEDPIGIAGGLNLYGYANGDPINFSDPFGLCPMCVLGAAWALYEIGSGAYDAYNAVRTVFSDASLGEKATTVGLAAASVFLPGGGYTAGAKAFGRTSFRGLIQNRQLADLTGNEITSAFAETGFTISSHAVSRLKDPRTANLGATTLNDIANLLNKGSVLDAGGGDVAIQLGRLEAIVNPETRVIETIRPFRNR
jgi:hypothetical protein